MRDFIRRFIWWRSIAKRIRKTVFESDWETLRELNEIVIAFYKYH